MAIDRHHTPADHRGPAVSRRHVLSGLAASAAVALGAPAARAENLVIAGNLRGAHDVGFDPLTPAVADRASKALQNAIDRAAREGRVLSLPPGTITVSNITLADGIVLEGVPGLTRLVYGGRGHLLSAGPSRRVTLRGLTLDGANNPLGSHVSGLLHLTGVEDITVEEMTVIGSSRDAVVLDGCGGRVVRSTIAGARQSGLHAIESRGLAISGNTVADCGTGGIVVRRWSAGDDETLVEDNRIVRIGLHGVSDRIPAGIEINRASGVDVARNTVSDCAGTAISTIAASALRIAGNRVTRASTGISIRAESGHAPSSIVESNLIRRVEPLSEAAGKTRDAGTGLIVDADASVVSNIVEEVSAFGARLGEDGPFDRIIAFSGNSVRNARYGVGVPVAAGPGKVLIAANLFSAVNGGAVVGTRKGAAVTADLLAGNSDALPPHVAMERNALI